MTHTAASINAAHHRIFKVKIPRMKSTTASTSKNTTAFPLSLNHLTDSLIRRCHPSVT